ncbi:hypothetical protein SAMN05444365_10426 [Micromonospora pattaloongensis]|uniref:Uncharacterized protein n=1 Tax=Micromonospora pattaloongensis TaxID=405436 RepID=A0A1H3NJS2_9ACTN|nr:hypothetical protein [Micromonospora pattaloongensis]SDY89132.1 hypothetical protein SAMN05444365_10426 [Micromonospora pattaloongensis]
MSTLEKTAKPWIRRPVGVLAVIAAVALIGVVGAVVGVRTLGSSGPPSSADQPYYESTEALEGKADVIVRASIVSTLERTSNGFPETVATISITKVAKGDAAAGGRMTFSYPTPGSGPESPTGLSAGKEYVLLLVRFDDGAAGLVNTTQGYYPVLNGRAVTGTENSVELSPDVKTALGTN